MASPVVHYGFDNFTACSLGRLGWKHTDKTKVTCNSCKSTLKWRTDAFAPEK